MGIPLYGQNKDGNSLEKFSDVLSGSITWDAASIDDGNEEAKELTVDGAELGDFVLSSLSADIEDLVLDAQVTAADTVTAILANNTGGAVNLGSCTLNVLIVKAV
tara:strand:+ start:113 stop:427 length:315 start_codon:yes stop_codon:yes gene_type:complete